MIFPPRSQSGVAETPGRAARKVLIVIGDGNDTNNEAALPAFAELKKRAARERIQTFSLIYKSSSQGAKERQ